MLQGAAAQSIGNISDAGISKPPLIADLDVLPEMWHHRVLSLVNPQTRYVSLPLLSRCPHSPAPWGNPPVRSQVPCARVSLGTMHYPRVLYVCFSGKINDLLLKK